MNKVRSKSSTRGRMKTRRTEDNAVRGVNLTMAGKKYNVPQMAIKRLEKQLESYRVRQDVEDGGMNIEEFFSDEYAGNPQWALNLRGLRYREDLTQIEFAEKIGVSQGNLSAMENGRRPIGKEVARRIGEVFGADYRLFL